MFRPQDAGPLVLSVCLGASVCVCLCVCVCVCLSVCELPYTRQLSGSSKQLPRQLPDSSPTLESSCVCVCVRVCVPVCVRARACVRSGMGAHVRVRMCACAGACACAARAHVRVELPDSSQTAPRQLPDSSQTGHWLITSARQCKDRSDWMSQTHSFHVIPLSVCAQVVCSLGWKCLCKALVSLSSCPASTVPRRTQ